jgi:phage terminase large subunit-like protein
VYAITLFIQHLSFVHIVMTGGQLMTWCVHNDLVRTVSNFVLIVKTGGQLMTWCVHNDLVCTASNFILIV